MPDVRGRRPDGGNRRSRPDERPSRRRVGRHRLAHPEVGHGPNSGPRMTPARTLVSLFLFDLAGLAAAGLDHSVQAAAEADLMGPLPPGIGGGLPQWGAGLETDSRWFEVRG